MQQQRRFQDRNKKHTSDKHETNESIKAKRVRLIDDAGEAKGIVSIDEALAIAREAGLDLVQVAADADPPVCKILDYGKLKYKEQKKAAEARKKTAVFVVKELRIRYRTDKHDLDTKLRKARKFLEGGDRVRFQMRFRGREVVYRDLGVATFDQVVEQLADIADVEERSPLAGNRMTITFVPKTAK